MLRGVQALQISRDGAGSTRQSVLASPTAASPLSSVDRDVDDGSDADGGGDDDDDDDEDGAGDDGEDETGVMDDVDQVDASGRVLNDGDELLDEPPPPSLPSKSKSARGIASASAASATAVSRSSAYSTATLATSTTTSTSSSFVASIIVGGKSGELLAGAGSSHNPDGTRRIWLCPSKYGRPSTVYFDYPLAFGMARQQRKVLCEKPCTLRFLHADSACIYTSVTGTLKRAGFLEQLGTTKREAAQWNVRFGKHMMTDAFKELKSYQKINHFPGTGGIGRKDRLARNIAKARRRFGGVEYNFLPETYLLPADRSLWEMKFAAEPPGTLWISKPNSSSCGRGIKLVSKLSDLPAKRSCIVSRYIHTPLLVAGRKFDLRIYVLVTSFHPLKVYVYENGLARFCTEPYDLSRKNLRKKYIHLTNFSVNKRSTKFVRPNTDDQHSAAAAEEGDGGESASKWSLVAFKKYLHDQYGRARCDLVWQQVNDIFIKTLLSVETHVASNVARLGGHRDQCFELFGFDILLDASLKPYLMEVNCAPSLSSSSPLDKRIKNELLTDVFHTAGIKPAYVKDHRGEEKPTTKGKKERKESARTTTTNSAATAAAATLGHGNTSSRQPEIRTGGTMGPSNSKTSRAASASAASASSSSSSSGAANLTSPSHSSSSSSPSAMGDGSANSGGGGRVSKLKSSPASSFFSRLSASDLALVREFRDEVDRAESGKWRLIFPIGATSAAAPSSPSSGAAASSLSSPFTASSYDLYAHLFEVEKYETLLLMRFQKHFAEPAKERICQGGEVGENDVLYEAPTHHHSSISSSGSGGGGGGGGISATGAMRASSAGHATAYSKRASTGGLITGGPLHPRATSSQPQARPASTTGALMGSNAVPPNAYTYASASPTSASASGSPSASPAASSSSSPSSSSSSSFSPASPFSPPYSALSSTPSPSTRGGGGDPSDSERRLLPMGHDGVHRQRRSSSFSPSEEEEEDDQEDKMSHPLPSSSSSASYAVVSGGGGSLMASTVSPLDSSPEDSETDSHGRPKRRYFYDRERGVALQPYLPHAPQYHEGWDSRPGSSAGAAAAAAAAVLQQQQLFMQHQHQQHHQQQQQQHQSSVPSSPARPSRPISAARARAGPAAAASVVEYQAIPTTTAAAYMHATTFVSASVSAAAASSSSASSSSSSSPSAHHRSRSSDRSAQARRSTGMVGTTTAYQAVPTMTTQQQHQSHQQSAQVFSRPLSSTQLRFGSAGAPVHSSTTAGGDFLAASSQQQPQYHHLHGSAGSSLRSQGGHRMTMPTSSAYQPVAARYQQAPSRMAYAPASRQAAFQSTAAATGGAAPPSAASGFLASGSSMSIQGGPILQQPPPPPPSYASASSSSHGHLLAAGADGTIGRANSKRASLQQQQQQQQQQKMMQMPFGTAAGRQHGW